MYDFYNRIFFLLFISSIELCILSFTCYDDEFAFLVQIARLVLFNILCTIMINIITIS